MISQTNSILSASIGGILIGCAAALMLLLNGRLTGVSGITNGIFTDHDRLWRVCFVGGLISGGAILVGFHREWLLTDVNTSTLRMDRHH